MKFIAGSHHLGHLTYRYSEASEKNVLNQAVDDAEQLGEVVWNACWQAKYQFIRICCFMHPIPTIQTAADAALRYAIARQMCAPPPV